MGPQLTGEDAVRHTHAEALEGGPYGYAVSIQGSRAQLRPGGFAKLGRRGRVGPPVGSGAGSVSRTYSLVSIDIDRGDA